MSSSLRAPAPTPPALAAPAPPTGPAVGPDPAAGTLTRGGLAVLLLAYAPVNIVFGSANVLADPIGRDLGADASGQQLVLAAYTTAFAASLVIAGRLGDRWGRRRLLLVGSLSMVLMSVLTAFAPTLHAAVVLRVLLGVAAGLLTPQVLSTIRAAAPEPLRTTGLMLFAAVAGVSTVVGQLMAGLVASALPEHLGWRAVQLLIGLIALIGAAGLPRVPRTRSSAPLALDAGGAALLGATLLLLVIPLTLGRSAGWPLWTLLSLAAGVLALALFWMLQRRSERAGRLGVVPPSALALPVVHRGLLMALLFFVTYGAFLYEVTSFAQLRTDGGTLGPALLVLGFGIAFVTASALLPRLLPGAGPRTMTRAAVAQALALLALAALVLTGHSSPMALQWGLVPLGAAQALMFGPLLSTVLSQAPQWAAGIASGLFATAQQLGLTLGVAVLGGLFWSLAGADGGAADHALVVVLAVHALCALVFAALARSLRQSTGTSSRK
ncbi:MFS transporter [Brachybacterium sp. NBEC-018]|uniref:MFS transporter n=1 Tax=Brachybacterium sp. NBEC-018 TaxID=2996004 RepID=UPI00217542DA|nr:MFS transporter [Brachybacterium sp. NBEC-018]UVY85206.1 MFS transporter [Brachybacterium sp. NBEC-018]